MALPAALKRKETIDPGSPGRSEAVFLPRPFKPFPSAFPVAFKALVMAPMTVPIVTPAATKMAATVTPYFLKISLILSRGGSALSLFDLGSQPSEFLLSFFNSSFCGFSFRRRSVLISDNPPVLLILFLKLSFLFLKVLEGFCAVKAFFESTSFSLVV